MTEGLRNDPRKSLDWRTYRTGCPHYRVRWLVDTDTAAGEPLYQVFCAQNTPPETTEEQSRCLNSPHRCWRLEQHAEAAQRTAQPDATSPAS